MAFENFTSNDAAAEASNLTGQQSLSQDMWNEMPNQIGVANDSSSTVNTSQDIWQFSADDAKALYGEDIGNFKPDVNVQTGDISVGGDINIGNNSNNETEQTNINGGIHNDNSEHIDNSNTINGDNNNIQDNDRDAGNLRAGGRDGGYDCEDSHRQDNCGYDRQDDWEYDYDYHERGHDRGHGDRSYDYRDGSQYSERELSDWFNGRSPQEQAQLLGWLAQEHAGGGPGYSYVDQPGYGDQYGYGGQPFNPMDPFNLAGMFNQYNRMTAQAYTQMLEPWMPLAQEVAPTAGDFTGHAVGGAAKAVIAA